MEGIDLIIDALAAGAASGTAASVRDTADSAVTKAYRGLKSALRRAFSNGQALPADDADALAAYEKDRQAEEKNLREKISVTEAYLSDEVINAALQLLRLLDTGKHTSNREGDARIQVIDSQGVQLITDQAVGDQHNDFRNL